MGLAFAEQELRLYQRIRPEEFIEKVVHPGSVDAPNVKCRHLVAMIGWANQVGRVGGPARCDSWAGDDARLTARIDAPRKPRRCDAGGSRERDARSGTGWP